MIAFVNGSLFDGHHHRGRLTGAVLVDDGRIVAVDAPRADVPSGAEVVDLDGGLLGPGFVDAHVHAVQGGLERIRCDLSEDRTREDYLRRISAYAASHPDLPWILGGGWSMAAFENGAALAADLDAVVPDRPVYLLNRDHHGAWVNSLAMRTAGITDTSPDPAHGHFERDAQGRPSGTLHEGAMDLVQAIVPATTDEEYYRGLLEGQSYLHSLGVTGWQDAIVGAYGGIDDPGPTYAAAARNGDLTAFVVGALWWDRDVDESQIASLEERRRDFSHGRFRATSVKIMQDGILENGTAAVSAPYLDRCGHATTNTGHSFVDPAALRRYLPLLEEAGFQVHVHAIGDRGVAEALDAFATVSQQGPSPLRHHLAHLQLVAPDDVRRFAELGVTANMQALWACYDEQMTELTLPFLDPAAVPRQYPFAELHRAGAPLAMGSDWPVSTPDPLQAIHVAVNRWAYGEPGRAGSEPLLPEQALDLETAFAAYTSGSAWVNHREDEVGAVRPGLAADLVVLDRDPFTADVAEIGAARVVATYVEGRPVLGPRPRCAPAR
ncbi:amidohydrolase [Nocardioides sp. HDW12B]|uniref:amidohydrolase n=1 Tax=Nocardioides sp. HDW12B TaxID=2714939 RepID=UPI0014079A56|nr:amidohydrolase [Nocardioides sp. HDW12B]QIK67192.1 amidohydrolase [Nocardioides sp. HDW12B]